MYIPFSFWGNKQQYRLQACNSTASYVVSFEADGDLDLGEVIQITNNSSLTDCYQLNSYDNNIQAEFLNQIVLSTYTNCVSCSNSFVNNGLIIHLESSSFYGTSSLWYDTSGNNNNAIVSGTINYNNVSSSWEFTTGSYLTFSGSLTNQPTGSYTVQWIGKLPIDTLTHTLFDRGFYLSSPAVTGSQGWDIIYDSDNQGFTYRNKQGVLNDRNIYYTGSANYGLYTITVDSEVTDLVKLYFNNSLIGTFIAAQASTTPFKFPDQFPTASFIFGNGSGDDGADVTYNGGLKELMLYNRTLSIFEVSRNYNYYSSSISSSNHPTFPSCRTWSIYGGSITGATISVSYLNCSNVSASITTPRNVTNTICTLSGSTPTITSQTGNGSLTYVGTSC
jgi:hypothetical protein